MLTFTCIRPALLVAVLSMAVWGCSETAAPEPEYNLRISLSGSDTLRARNEWRLVEATAADDAGQPVDAPIVLSFDSPGVLQIVQLTSRTALIYAVADGSARVTASAGRSRMSIDVIVRRRAVAFRFLSHPQQSMTLSLGGQQLLQPFLVDSSGFVMPLPAAVSYTSDDSSIVHVNPQGLLTGVQLGATWITGRLVVPESTIVERLNVSVRSPTALFQH